MSDELWRIREVKAAARQKLAEAQREIVELEGQE